ncbi:TATA box-binding protein-associated factor RNA polymerase I subunit C-like [Lasioglossum baleicum]|uniref:TATA box-binding protein-associated factor RNA polymerase I subunit C-like n=1 Tax=Lasioglossum baleicum TaxID=434251 RepID=UPI003FCCD76F
MEDQNILTSKAYKRADTNLRDRLKPSFLKNYPHYLVPGYNLHNNFSVDDVDLENAVEQYQDYPYHCDLPRPLLPPVRVPRTVLNKEDPALELLTLKNHMNDDNQRLKHYYLKHEKELGQIRKHNIKWQHTDRTVTAKMPKYVADIAEIMDLDPDPYFEGAYNWYFTGGTMDHVQIYNKNVLLFPFMGELVATPVVNVDEFFWKPMLQKAAKCELDGSLFELKHNINSNSCTILGRYKNHCNFYILSEHNEKWHLTEIHRQASNIPLVSTDLSIHNSDQYCTVNAERNVTLWDITKMKHISSNTVMQTTVADDLWGRVKFETLDPNIILFVDRCYLHYLDIRIPYDRPALSLCPKPFLEKCENITLDIESRHHCCRYVGTSHSLLMCDKRSPKQCVQQKWTHQFTSPPLIGQVANREDKEFIVLSSQVSTESIVILNTWTSDEISHSFNFPYTPANIMETLNESQLQGMCLNPYLRNRFELSNVGSALIGNEAGDIFLFLQNSIGDVCYQCITHDTAMDKYSAVNCRSYCILNAWELAVSSQAETIVPLTISETSNMQHIYKCFTNKKLRLKSDDCESHNYFDPSWKQSLEKLNSYMDILAPELLAVWEICEEVPLPLTAAPHQKVLSWLESADTKAPIPSQEEFENIATPVNTQELISVSQEVDITTLEDSNVLQELLLPKVKSHSKKGHVRKKRKL